MTSVQAASSTAHTETSQPALVSNESQTAHVRLDVSVIAPLYNEVESIGPLIAALLPVMKSTGKSFEIILVNDGSSDGTGEAAAELCKSDSRVKLINLRKNAGQTAALMAGFDHASGSVIVPMDGDLQNDPIDIPRLLAKLEEGYDVVSGWRKDRADKLIVRKLPSWAANRIISWVSGVPLHDYGCTLKAYRRDVLSGVRLYGELHRFIPIFASWQGGQITEMEVTHHARQFGNSKYGLNKIFKVVLDLMLVRFLTKYQSKPIYVFGYVGAIFFVIALLAAIYAIWLKYVDGISFIQTPLPLLFAMGFMMGFICILLGLISELLVRTYFESQSRTHYIVGSRINIADK